MASIEVLIEIEGKSIKKETNMIFHTTYKFPRLDDYKNKKVKIGYNSFSEQVIIVDL